MTERPPMSFDITWHNGRYYVSEPNYEGGTVYTKEAVDALVKALNMARARIEYLGVVSINHIHYDENEKTFLPEIDRALNLSVGQRTSQESGT